MSQPLPHRPEPAGAPAHPRRWRPSRLLQLSLLLHAAAIAGVLLQPRVWPWWLSAVIADHLLLTAIGLWPRSQALGSNWVRLPAGAVQRREVAITIDDGPDAQVTPQVLAILERYGARATFFCIGERVEQISAPVRACVLAGHAIENHSYRHRHSFSLLGLGGLRREIERAQHAITRVSGSAPQFFRAPAGLRSPLLDPVLQRLGLQLASWTRRGFDTVRADPEQIHARLTRNLAAGDILLLHDGHAAVMADGTPVILSVLPRLLETLASQSLRAVTLRQAAT